MVMETIQIRLTREQVNMIDGWIERGIYASRSEAIRDCTRRVFLERHIGSIPNTGDSVKEVRAIRKKLSKADMDIAALNKL